MHLGWYILPVDGFLENLFCDNPLAGMILGKFILK